MQTQLEDELFECNPSEFFCQSDVSGESVLKNQVKLESWQTVWVNSLILGGMFLFGLLLALTISYVFLLKQFTRKKYINPVEFHQVQTIKEEEEAHSSEKASDVKSWTPSGGIELRTIH